MFICFVSLARSRNLDVHERRVLLAAVSVGVVDIALYGRARYRSFHRERVVAIEELHLARLEPVTLRHGLASEDARALDAAVARFVFEHDVERELERARVLAADQPCELGELGHAFSSSKRLPSTPYHRVRNISCGLSGSTTWFTLKR